MRLIDADALKAKLIEERDAIPLTRTDRYCFGVEFPNQHGTSMRGGINKAFRCMEQTPTIDAVPVAQLREMLSNLERMCRGGDEGETYTTGYRNGHHNGQIELLRYILQVPDGTSEDTREDS